MPNPRIAEMACLIPAEASYRCHSSGDEVALVAEAYTDPTLGAKFVDAFVEVRKPLPDCTHETELLRAYAHRRFGTPDPGVEAAFALENGANARQRIRVRCRLLRKEYTFADIGQRTGLTADSVSIYHGLFWPVRDRDGIFTTSLMYPNSWQCEFEPGDAQKVSEENLAYRVAVNHGMEAVECLLGRKNNTMKQDLNELADDFMRQILDNGVFLADCGFLNQDLPGLKDAIAVARVVNSRRRQRQENVPAQDINRVSAAVAVSQSLAQPEVGLNRWPGQVQASNASQNAPVGQSEKTTAVPAEQTRRPKRTKTKKTSNPVSAEPGGRTGQLQVAA